MTNTVGTGGTVAQQSSLQSQILRQLFVLRGRGAGLLCCQDTDASSDSARSESQGAQVLY